MQMPPLLLFKELNIWEFFAAEISKHKIGFFTTISCIPDHTNRNNRSSKICQFYAVLLIVLVHQLHKLAGDQNSLG